MFERKFVCSLSLCWLIALVATFSLGCWASDDVEDSGGFLSDDPNRGTVWAGAGVGTGGGSGGGASAGFVDTGDEAERAIEEADIIQVADGRLYTLSLYGGLCVIDISVQGQLTLLGRYRIRGYPVEMILRDNTVIAIVNAPLLGWDDAWGASTDYISRVVALDTTDPSAIEEMGSIEVSGEFVDSHLVNDVFYVVTHEGYTEPATTEVLSLSVADPASVRIIDREVFNSYGCGPRSCVTVAKDRMYVAGDELLGDYHSSIQVVDISDPGGTMELGALVEVAGQVDSRSQMDEHEGTLRVISQVGASDLPKAVVETFSVISAQQVSPIGSLEVVSAPELLRSVRFDGERAYAVNRSDTYESTDALRTFDLSDPANPRQVGVLEVPTLLLRIEPHGDRLIGFGYDVSSPDGGITVSLFDITDLGNPTVLDGVNIGMQPRYLSERQDRIDKSLVILDDDGLILVPFSAKKTSDACDYHENGIQLIDFTADALSTRGIATERGRAPRAFLHEDRLFTVSDGAVSIFDIADRGAPTVQAHLALSHDSTNTAVIGGSVAQVERDTDGVRLFVVPLDTPESDEPIGSLDLSNLSPCLASYAYGPRVMAFDSYAVLLWANRQFSDHGVGGHGTGMAVIDLSDPTNPTLMSHTDFDFDLVGFGQDEFDTAGPPILTTGQAYVLVGTTLVLQEASQRTEDEMVKPCKLHLLDLSDPASPVVASTVTLPTALGQTPLQAEGNIIFTSRWEPVDPGTVRFWVDRIDISNPAAPQVLAPINVPGSLVARDANTGRMATVDYTNEIVSAADSEQCQQLTDSTGRFRYDSGECVVTHRTLQLVDVQGSTATLRDSLPLEDGDYGPVALGEDRLFFVRYGMQDLPGDPHRLSMVSGMGEGAWRPTPSTTVSGIFGRLQILAHGKRVLALDWFPATMMVFDGTDAASAPTLVKSEELWGKVSNVTLHGEDAICSLGDAGVSVFSLSE